MDNNSLQLIIALLGGGILGALINRAGTSRSERTARKHEFLTEQITKLYGPLYFFVGLNEALFALNGSFHKAYKEHFVDQKWATNPNTQESLRKEASTTMEIINHYAGIVRDNNFKVVELLRENYAYIDPQDTEVFQRFVIDHLRLEREFKTAKPLDTPLEIYFKVGEISLSRPEFLELVKSRFLELVKSRFVEKNNVIKSIL